MGARGLGAETCAGAGRLQVAIQVSEAADQEALSTQIITQTLTVTGRPIEMWEGRRTLRNPNISGVCSGVGGGENIQRTSSDEVVRTLEGKR